MRFIIVLLLGAASGCGGCNRTPPAAPAAKPAQAPQAPVKAFQPTPELVAEHNQGVGHMGKFEFAPAQAIFADLAKRHPDWADVKVDLAIATFNQQKPDESFASQYIVDSLAILDEVLQREHEHLRARYCKGVLLYYLGKTDEAKGHFEFVAAKDAADAFATYFVGRCLFNEGKFEEALAHYQQAIDRDPYFASAYYAAFQTLQRLHKPDEAKAMMADFQKLEGNPQARKEAMKYTRMGAKADVVEQYSSVPLDEAVPVFREDGRIFAPPNGMTWRDAHDVRFPKASVTACDLDHDGRLDIFLAAGVTNGNVLQNVVFLQPKLGRFEIAVDHPLATVDDVSAISWGDFDNDGLTDAYFGRRGANQLWRQTSVNVWEDVTSTTGTSAGEGDTVDTMMIDFDHDGDLDLIVLRDDASKVLFSNNRDGTFRSLGAEAGIELAPPNTKGQQILATDLDRDRDVDLMFLHEQPPHEVYANDRLWSFAMAKNFNEFASAKFESVIAIDTDPDGLPQLFTISGAAIDEWIPNDVIGWQTASGNVVENRAPGNVARLAAGDFDGNGRWELVVGDVQGIRLVKPGWRGPQYALSARDVLGWSTFSYDGVRPSVVWFVRDGNDLELGSLTTVNAAFAGLTFSGKEEKQDEMRSNRSGIGVKVNARIGSKWFSAETFRNDSGPGQSLMPLTFGTGGADKVDFVMLHWSDGVFQTETNLEAGKLHHIEETQRQTSSCPLVFVWDGEKFAFVTDILGVGGIGFNVGKGEYAPPDPTENLLLPEGLLKPRDGRYVLKLHEPMEEATYLDHAQLAVYDLPPGWQLALDERFGGSDPQPTGEAIFYRDEVLPSRAINDRDEDVTARVTAVDNDAAPPGKRDPRFIGLTERSSLVLEFSQPLDQHVGQPTLIADGWVEYPYSQTMFAAWQAGAKYEIPTLEARDAQGAWQVIHAEFGYPAGMPRRMALPLAGLPAGATALRIATTYEVYWDRLAVAFAEACPEARRTAVSADVARLSRTGFPLRTNGPQRRPYYDYAQRAPFDDMRHQAGWYTAFGDVRELTHAADDALAVFGPGEEVQLEFAAPDAPPSGWNRRLVLETVGWCKDMDLFTETGDTVEPLSARGERSTEARNRLHDRYNTRYESGN